MRFSRARYVTLCQQSLVTAAVLAVGVSAAGVKTLEIVPQPSPLAAPQGQAKLDVPAPRDRTLVDREPVSPEVREVAVTGIEVTPEKDEVEPAPEEQPRARRA